MHHRSQPPPPVPEDLLAGLDPLRRETFALRVARWWPDLAAGLAGIPAQLPSYREAMARRASR